MLPPPVSLLPPWRRAVAARWWQRLPWPCPPATRCQHVPATVGCFQLIVDCCLCSCHHCHRRCLHRHRGGTWWHHGGGGSYCGHARRHRAANALPAASAAAAIIATTAKMPLPPPRCRPFPTAVLPPMMPHCRHAAAKLPS